MNDPKHSDKATKKFNRRLGALRRMISYWVGDDNWAGHSAQVQLDRVQEKFWDCVHEE